MAGSPRHARRPTLPAARTVVAIAVGLTALVVYRLTMLQGVGAWDTAEAQTVPPILGTMHPTGFPAYVVLGFVATRVLAPLGSPAFAMNLLSTILPR